MPLSNSVYPTLVGRVLVVLGGVEYDGKSDVVEMGD